MNRSLLFSITPRSRRFAELYAWLMACCLGSLLLTGCTAAPPAGGGGGSGGGGDKPDDTPTSASAADCLGCHTDEALLKAVAREEPPPVEDAGEG
jgi:hypothetical protein